MATAKKTTKSTGSGYDGFTEDEKAAMKEHAADMKRAAKKGSAADAEGEIFAKIAEMSDADRPLAEKVHDLVKKNAPDAGFRTWYGMPAYTKNGKIICFFQPALKFKARYSTLGFNEDANLDEGNVWATAFALSKLTAADEKRLGALVKQAFS
ncbi:DUF1801 domain-containing protein [Asanoa sp. WMMD1127]|uniref:iron chaperone n=1 Tax=Asanoa sp. WMMD1127 TaxID=3016107 RepID=UPI00241745D0|nr:DUF1801 domain-containing protein [Asanoa sp. WMMD1127]MDG4826419.1 DUF1801 domain-containing protein [Asanoa sp. WMMD1127]